LSPTDNSEERDVESPTDSSEEKDGCLPPITARRGTDAGSPTDSSEEIRDRKQRRQEATRAKAASCKK